MVTSCSEELPAASVATKVKLCESASSKLAAKPASVVTTPLSSMLKPMSSSLRLKVISSAPL
jgi:hypothetical protein